ncbi:MAG TPA: glycosyltransferase [Chloroflexota bacterium]|nr:glycosyltransferase [Chloroflexota bacterium]
MMRLVLFGLSIASSWGNGHATTYRGLLRELARRGHETAFFERRTPWYDANCDMPAADYTTIVRYESWPPPGVEEAVAEADVVVLGSYAADGEQIADWLPGRTRARRLYYDIDTPVTLEHFRQSGRTEYLRPDQLARFDLVLSFAGGPVLDELRRWGAVRAEPFYCAVDPAVYRPVAADERFRCDLGYMGTYAPDRQPALCELFLAPAQARPEWRFVLAGSQYPEQAWPPNVSLVTHVPPSEHARFHSSVRWELNLTRQAMKRYGWSPSVRLFEAAACGAAILSDCWAGFETIFAPEKEALLVDSQADVLAALELPAEARARLGEAARQVVLREHTYAQRVDQLEAWLAELGVAGAPAGAARRAVAAVSREHSSRSPPGVT